MKTYNYVPYYYYYFDEAKPAAGAEASSAPQDKAKPDPTEQPNGSPKKWSQLDQQIQTDIFNAAKPFMAKGQPLPESMKIYESDLKNEYNKAKQSGSIDEQAEKKAANTPEAKEQMDKAKKDPGFLKKAFMGLRDKIRGYDDDVKKLMSKEHLREMGLGNDSQQQATTATNNTSSNNMNWMNNPMMMAMMGGGGMGFNPFMMQYMMQMMQNMQGNQTQEQSSGPQRMTASEAASSIKQGMKAMKSTGRNLQKVKDIVLKIQKKYGDDAAAEQAQAYGGYTLEDLGIKPSGK